MNTKYTKGEWIVKHSESKNAFNVIGTVLGGKYKIARCPYVDEFDKDEAKANAKLIVVAPELLRSLKIMTDLCRLKYGNLDKDIFTEIEKAEDIIKKATE